MTMTFRDGFRLIIVAALLATALGVTRRAWAHCDTLNGPVVKAARHSLETGDADYVLIWVKPGNEVEVRRAFAQTMAVRRLGPQARELADLYFFETVVHLHRAGEGAPYSGLKSVGDLGPAIPAADRAIAPGGSISPLAKLLTDATEAGLRTHYEDVVGKRNYQPHDVAAGRSYVEAYVEYVHYVERLYEAAVSSAHGHYAETTAGGDEAPGSR